MLKYFVKIKSLERENGNLENSNLEILVKVKEMEKRENY